MTVLVIVLVAVVILGVVALVAFNPGRRTGEDAAIAAVNDSFGDDRRKVIEPRAIAMSTEPEEAGGVRGMSVLAVNSTELVAHTWAGGKEFRIPRSSITSVESSADDPESVQKATIIVHFTSDAGPATASFRLRDPVPWLTELGYDWGPEGPPEAAADDDGADADES
jgi:hypothetical protein